MFQTKQCWGTDSSLGNTDLLIRDLAVRPRGKDIKPTRNEWASTDGTWQWENKTSSGSKVQWSWNRGHLRRGNYACLRRGCIPLWGSYDRKRDRRDRSVLGMSGNGELLIEHLTTLFCYASPCSSLLSSWPLAPWANCPWPCVKPRKMV